jgi:hypothetical protein
MPVRVIDHAAMKNTGEPPFGTAEYEMLGLERIVSTAGEGHEGVSAFLTATVTFAGDGDMVQEAEVFQRAAGYFRAHPELKVTARELDHLHGGQRGRAAVRPGAIRGPASVAES